MSTETILGKLHALEESPWGDWYGKPLNARGLAKLLKPYQVKRNPGPHRREHPRGYRRSDLHEAWRSYLPGGSETSATSATSLASHVLDVADVAFPGRRAPCAGEPLDPVAQASGDRNPMCDQQRKRREGRAPPAEVADRTPTAPGAVPA